MVSSECLTLFREIGIIKLQKWEMLVFIGFGRLYRDNNGVLRLRTVSGTVERWHQDHNGAGKVPAVREGL